MEGVCYIVGAGDNEGTLFIKKPEDFVIAADGGLLTINGLGIVPDIILGDFDSLGYVPKGDNIIRHKVEKDDTDMMLAVEKAIELGYHNITIFGGTGGRTDHTIANLQTMLYASTNGVNIKMMDSGNVYRVITDEKITLQAKNKGTFSVFAMGGRAKGVNIEGAMYSMKNGELTSDNPTAVSNSFAGHNVNISVEEGSLLIIEER